jgi:hypothetical protein
MRFRCQLKRAVPSHKGLWRSVECAEDEIRHRKLIAFLEETNALCFVRAADGLDVCPSRMLPPKVSPWVGVSRPGLLLFAASLRLLKSKAIPERRKSVVEQLRDLGPIHHSVAPGQRNDGGRAEIEIALRILVEAAGLRIDDQDGADAHALIVGQLDQDARHPVVRRQHLKDCDGGAGKDLLDRMVPTEHYHIRNTVAGRADLHTRAIA